MAGLRRFDNNQLFVRIVAGALIVLLVLGALAFAFRSGSAESGAIEVPSEGTLEAPEDSGPAAVDGDSSTAVSDPSNVSNGGGGSSGAVSGSGSGSSKPVFGSSGGSAGSPPDAPAGSTVNSSGPPAASDPDTAVASDMPLLVSPEPAPPIIDGIDSFEECAAAGYPIAESYPEQCFVPGGRGFTRQI